YPKESGLWIDGPQPARDVGFDPGDVVADGPYLPAVKALRRNHHGKVRFAAGARESGRNISLLALWIFDAEDQHVLGHPAFVARHVGSDAKREAFLAKQRIAAVARTIRPDLAGLREVHDVLGFIARPRHILLSGRQRHSDAVHARDHALLIAVDSLKYGKANARH